MKRIILLWVLLLTIGIAAWAEEVTFTATATPDAVAVGDQLRLSYTITTQDVRDFRAPSIKGFDVLMGPSRSQQRNIQIINGKTTSTKSITFTYILLATSKGNFTIPGATITAEGNQMVSNAVIIKVLPADETSNQKNNGSASNNNTISNKDLFVTATVNKTRVYEQEAILLTYKIYTQVDLRAFDNIKLPDFKGFHSQEIELGNNRKWELEHYKGRNYQATIYRQFLLFPQQTGKLTIDAARFDASIAVASNSIDPFDAFFNGGRGIEVKKSLFTPKQTIDVQPLPSKPANFSGGVGEFHITSSINASDIKTNDAVTIKIVISGTGNLKLIANPEVRFPEDFEVYDPKSENNSRLTNAGLSGNKVIEYLAIPRNPGDYQIPAVEFTYFDVKSQSYKTLKTEDYQIRVEKGEGGSTQNIVNFSNKEELKVLNEDIRFIKQNDIKLIPRGQFFFDTFNYWLYYLMPLVIFIVLFVIYRKQIAANTNVAKIRTRKANKVAVKRLKLSGKLLSTNKRDEFYDEVLKALWGYVSDKLNIPMSRLSKDNIEEELHNYGVDHELIKEFLGVLDNCEFARFAPSEASVSMDKIYNEALEIISKMENSIKN